MGDFAIRAENLGKQYYIGDTQPRYKTLRESIAEGFQAPARRLLSVVRGQSTFASNETIWALKDLSFEIRRGDVVGIIGRNGAGKTTLLKILSRITEPTEGRARIRGRVGSLLEVGTGFHAELTGRENTYLNGAILGMKRQELDQKFDEIVAFAEIEKFIDTPVKHYSSGMHVRLAFAVAAHLEPDILLVDEVLAVGDASFQKKCLGKMKDVSQQGRTVLFVSHNLDAVANLCETAYWLEQGRINRKGEVMDVLQSYLMKNITAQQNDLSDHPNRKGSHKIMRFVHLVDKSARNNGIVTQGPFCFEVECDVDAHWGKQLTLGFHLRDSLGRSVFAAHMNQHRYFNVQSRTRVVFQAFIEELPLAPGSYSLSLYLGNGSYDLDIVEDAIYFDVLWNKDLELAYPPRPKWGPAFMTVQWDVRDAGSGEINGN